MGEILKNENCKKSKKRLIPITVRFTEDAMSVFDEMSKQYGRTKGDLIRLVIDNRLEDFLQKCIYIEQEDAMEMRKLLFYIYTEMQSIRSELHRIGVNFNQKLKLEQTQKKHSGKLDYDELKRKMNMKEDTENSLSREELDMLLTRYEKATETARLILCHIQE